MKKHLLIGISVLAAAVSACGSAGDEQTGPADFDLSSELGEAAKAAKSPQLNLSHIECTPEGTVLAHFVLLFAGSGTPGTLSGTYNGGSFGPTAPWKNTGNVWHYNVILPAGDIEILSATVSTSNGTVVNLHNPSEYSGDYQCGEIECAVTVTPGPICLPVLGNPGNECGYFGLDVQGKDEDFNGQPDAPSQDANQGGYVAIVKSGNGGCGQGESSYNVYVNVSPNDELFSGNGQDVSHITYCSCPD